MADERGEPDVRSPFRKVLIANRGEIAIRVTRALNQLGIVPVAIYSHADRLSIHRYKAKMSFEVGEGLSPVKAYLAQEEIVALAKREGVDAIHPGYGFLSENADFAQKVIEAGIAWIGPTPDSMRALGDKARGRERAQECGVPVVPGSGGPVPSAAEALAFVQEFGLPVILKACAGGGGRGCRVVRRIEDVEEAFKSAASEAQSAFGDGSLIVERLVERPRHIEVQVLGDKTGSVVHLFERDCSLQRRHQKVIEIAPANGVKREVLERMYADAVRLARHCNYENAGTMEFLLDKDGESYYFIEVNPRIQVEHTITEQVTGLDLVEAQILIAGGASLADIGISQETITRRGHAMQCRITTEDPTQNFQPDCGRILVYRSAGGNGLRLDGSAGYVGATISPHYDSLLVKMTCSAQSWPATLRRSIMALGEMRIKGVTTNIPFLLNVLQHPVFAQQGVCWTTFIDDNPQLFEFPVHKHKVVKILNYLADVIVHGPAVVGAQPVPVPDVEQTLPIVDILAPPPDGWRKIFVEAGAEALARAVRAHGKALVTDTTWRDAHQSLLATRMRTYDLVKVAPHTARILAGCFSLEMWGGATFDVALRFLHEDPWKRLRKLRRACPNILFQMLLRGANAVGYKAYPDNVVYEFVKQAKNQGVDVFRVFDSLNYIDNLAVGIDAVLRAGGICEAAICYTGDVLDPTETKYNLEYYLDLVTQLVALGTHFLAIKDMAGLLKPRAATVLVGALRKKFPDLPIHVHTHDTAGTGVSSMLAAIEAGADIVDAATDAMSGLTSQPSLGAIVHSLRFTPHETDLDPDLLSALNEYWRQTRLLYAPFESNLKSAGSDVYSNEIPGGQLTNMAFQVAMNGLQEKWQQVCHAYREANELLGRIPKVTPSSKVCGDLAQFMVANGLDKDRVLRDAAKLSFPSSVVGFFAGELGVPPGGFPQPLTDAVLQGRKQARGRPGAEMAPVDFDEVIATLKKKRIRSKITILDALNYVLYPEVYEDYMATERKYGKNIASLPTKYFLKPLEQDVELTVRLSHGRTAYIQLVAVSELSGGKREVFFSVNGNSQIVEVASKAGAGAQVVAREKASERHGQVGSPFTASVVEVRAQVGQHVFDRDPLLVLSAMKIETVVASTCSGIVRRVLVVSGDSVSQGDLLVEIEPLVETADSLSRSSSSSLVVTSLP